MGSSFLLPTEKEIDRLCWVGKYTGLDGAVALRRERWKYLSPEDRTRKELIGLAVTHYSARLKMEHEVLYTFEWVAPELAREVDRPSTPLSANELDTISTHLFWYGEKSNQSHYREVAEKACKQGLALTENEPEGSHTGALLCTTYASILRRRGERRAGVEYLNEAFDRAGRIIDPNQKVRVYWRLAHGFGVRMPAEMLFCLWCMTCTTGATLAAKLKPLSIG